MACWRKIKIAVPAGRMNGFDVAFSYGKSGVPMGRGSLTKRVQAVNDLPKFNCRSAAKLQPAHVAEDGTGAPKTDAVVTDRG